MTSEHEIQRALHDISCHFLVGKNGMKLRIIYNDIKDKGIPLSKIYPEDGELIMLVDETKLKGDNKNE